MWMNIDIVDETIEKVKTRCLLKKIKLKLQLNSVFHFFILKELYGIVRSVGLRLNEGERRVS